MVRSKNNEEVNKFLKELGPEITNIETQLKKLGESIQNLQLY
tara:strand:+ start:1067 stop:1192 length:126 start_codon:yes stop_codon:yes gene_type:complete